MSTPVYIRLMRRQDVAQVSQIDREAFPTDWPPTNFTRELENRLAYYIVACELPLPTSSPAGLPPESGSKPLLSILKQLFSRRKSTGSQTSATGEERVVGYAGMWILADESHITSIASRKEYRGQGVGEALLIALVDLAARHKARIVTLEARISNTTAQNLYTKFGFQKMGVRQGYYLDNREDAVIMSTEYIGSASFQERFKNLKETHDRQCGLTRYEVETQNVKLG